MEKKEWLLKAEIFSSLDDRGLDLIAGYSGFVSYNSGDEVLAEGSRSGVLYIVVSGSVQVIRIDPYEGISIIAELVPGDIIGELEFFTGSDFNAAVIASSDSVLLRIPGDGESFRIILDAHPGIAAVILYEFLKVISGRIRNANSLVRENSALTQELKRQVYGDKLTGLLNKTYLEETLPGLMKNRSEPVGLLLMKPDNFKYINDTFGHEAGDDTLKIMAAALNLFMGERGTVLRYMGNELGVILPGRNRDECYSEAEKILAMFNSLDISEAVKTGDVKLSMSIGVAVFPGHADISEELILLAHELPLAGRAKGGNVILFPEDIKSDAE
jgi:diguanylate cyclase (GGDEF)-like protein